MMPPNGTTVFFVDDEIVRKAKVVNVFATKVIEVFYKIGSNPVTHTTTSPFVFETEKEAMISIRDTHRTARTKARASEWIVNEAIVHHSGYVGSTKLSMLSLASNFGYRHFIKGCDDLKFLKIREIFMLGESHYVFFCESSYVHQLRGPTVFEHTQQFDDEASAISDLIKNLTYTPQIRTICMPQTCQHSIVSTKIQPLHKDKLSVILTDEDVQLPNLATSAYKESLSRAK